MTSWEKYGGKAEGWSDSAYADTHAYLAHRAKIVRTLGPRVEPGDTVLDLACGDGALADHLPEQRYLGVDANAGMVDAGRARGREIVLADLNDYEPAEPVQVTTVFRAIYYALDRQELFRRIAGYTERKLVFDLNPRQFALRDVRRELEAAGFDRVVTRPFFSPQTSSLQFLTKLERSGPPARLLLRFRFTLLVAASRRAAAS